MIQKSSTFALLAFVAAVITAVAAQTNAPVRPDLSGAWQLNGDLSDDPQAKLQSMGGGGGHAGRGGGRGGHGPGHQGGGGRTEEKQLEGVQNLMQNAPTRFVLTQDDQKVVLTQPDGRVRTLPTNNRKVKIDGRDVRTRWENNRLVSETTMGNATLVETYERSPSAPQLIVTARIDMHGRQVIVRRVYDSVTE